MKNFNTAGPSKPDMHYMVDALARIQLDEVLGLIEAERYFVLHAPRQTGKTTALLALMAHLNAQGRYRALYVNIEGAQAARHDVAAAMDAICCAFSSAASVYLQDERPEAVRLQLRADKAPHDWWRLLLEAWARMDDRPCVLLLDEVDALVGDTLISLLRQIRAGYAQRPGAFPQSVILCGVRDVRDYRIHTAHHEIITGGSAFNIKATSIRLGNFSQGETIALWQQHESETGQPIDAAIYPELWEDTRGQPWLVNALGYECVYNDRELRHNRGLPVTLERYKAARERLIQSRATHLDQLTDKLQEARVRAIVADLLSGEASDSKHPNDDLQYVEDLGLIETRPQVRIANRIYQEVIPRELTWSKQVMIAHQQEWYLTPERKLDLPKLLAAFQQFFREHSEAWLNSVHYPEAGPQLLLQAFLQRIVNGGGRISREYGLARKRTDLFLEWPTSEAQGFLGPLQRVVLELKLVRQAPEAALQQGLQQTDDYAQRVGADEAHLLLFDRRADQSWEARIWQRQESAPSGRAVGVWGL